MTTSLEVFTYSLDPCSFRCRYCCSECGLAFRTKRNRVGIKIKMIPLSSKGDTCRKDESFISSSILVSTKSKPVFRANEQERLVQGAIGASSLDPDLPPWGKFSDPEDFRVKSEPLVDFNETLIEEKKNRLHFLEERDEDKLSRRLLALSRSNKVTSALDLFGSMRFAGLRPNGHSSNSLVSCLLRNRLFDKALSVFEWLRVKKITTGHTYSLILKAVASNEGYDSAMTMFTEFEKDSKSFDAVVYNTMISISGKVNNLTQAFRLWKSMKDNGIVGTEVTYSLLVSIFVRCGQHELALDAYSEMIQHRVKPREDAMHAIIGACAKEGKWDLALKVYHDMVKPNLIACNAVIGSLGKVGKVEEALKVFNKMKSLGHVPDEYTWNALLGAMYKAKQYGDVLVLFDCISVSAEKSSNIILNQHMYNTALMSCRKLGSWERALKLLWEMETSPGLSVSTTSYNLVIGTCEIARKPKVAMQVYHRMIHQKCTPDTFTLLSLIRSCVWGSLWEEVDNILNKVEPDVSLYNAAIHGMCLRGKIESAKNLYRKMQEAGLVPDGKTRALMLQSLQKRRGK